MTKVTIEPVPENDGPWHRKIVSETPIPHSRTGKDLVLECGHQVQSFGKLELTGGKVLCMACRAEAQP